MMLLVAHFSDVFNAFFKAHKYEVNSSTVRVVVVVVVGSSTSSKKLVYVIDAISTEVWLLL